MRKYLYIILLLLCTTFSSTYAQRLGLFAGPQLSYGVVSQKDKLASFEIFPNAGVHGGVLFEMDVTNRWGFDVAAIYELRNMGWNLKYNSYDADNNIVINDTTTIFHRQLGYMNIPFHFYVNFPTKSVTYSLFAGPVFTCGLHGRDMAWYDLENKKPVTFFEKDMFSADNKGHVVRCEFAIDAGIAFKWSNGVQFRASYQHSINNQTLKKYKYTLPLEKSTYYTQGSLKLTVAYMFDLRK